MLHYIYSSGNGFLVIYVGAGGLFLLNYRLLRNIRDKVHFILQNFSNMAFE